MSDDMRLGIQVPNKFECGNPEHILYRLMLGLIDRRYTSVEKEFLIQALQHKAPGCQRCAPLEVIVDGYLELWENRKVANHVPKHMATDPQLRADEAVGTLDPDAITDSELRKISEVIRLWIAQAQLSPESYNPETGKWELREGHIDPRLRRLSG